MQHGEIAARAMRAFPAQTRSARGIFITSEVLRIKASLSVNRETENLPLIRHCIDKLMRVCLRYNAKH